MKRVRELSLYLVALLLVVVSSPLFVRDSIYADGPALIISEIKIRNDTEGLDEYIEVYNPGAEDVSLAEFFLGYINTPIPNPDQDFAVSVLGEGLLEPSHSLVLARDELDPGLPNAKKSPFSSLSDSGGTLRITNGDEEIIDSFAWTSTSSVAVEPIQFLCTSGNATCNLNKTQSFQRSKDHEGHFVLTLPAWTLDTPDPESSIVLPLPEVEEPDTQTPEETEETTAGDETEGMPEPQAESSGILPLQITELLPNPAAPASDSTDEFIELYNPNDQEVNLSGYKLQSGSTFTYSHVFGPTILGAHDYKAFYVSETGNILSNASGQARLLDVNGAVVAQTNVYGTADEGHAWILINGVWQWTTTPTPNAANLLIASPLKLGAVKASGTKKTTKAAAKKKTAAAKTKKPAAAAASRQIYEDPEAAVANLHPNILAGVGVLTLVYAAYEYRHDFTNRLQQLKRNREIRSSSR